MQICYLINSLQRGGAENLLVELVREAPDEVSFQVCFLGGDTTLQSEFEAAGAIVENLNFSFPYDPSGIRRFVNVCRDFRPDLIHAHLPPSMVVGRIGATVLNLPMISTHHNVRENYQPVSKYLEVLTRSIDDRTIAVSNGVKSSFNENRGHWKTIMNGIDVQSFADTVESIDVRSIRDRWGLEDQMVLLNIARYVSQKRQQDLIDALDLINDQENYHLFLIGWGPRQSSLRQHVVSKGMEEIVSVTGYVEDVKPYYKVADAFVSASELEGLPITFLEAMAARLPIVATDIPGVREVVQDGQTGLLSPPGATDALAQNIQTLRSTDTCQRMGESGFERALAEFDLMKTVSEYLDVYRKVIETGQGTRGSG